MRLDPRIVNWKRAIRELDQMKPWHMLLCVAFVALGIVLVAVGADAVAFLPVLGCAAMMAVMV